MSLHSLLRQTPNIGWRELPAIPFCLEVDAIYPDAAGSAQEGEALDGAAVDRAIHEHRAECPDCLAEMAAYLLREMGAGELFAEREGGDG